MEAAGGFGFDFLDGGGVDGFGWLVRDDDDFDVVVHSVPCW